MIDAARREMEAVDKPTALDPPSWTSGVTVGPAFSMPPPDSFTGYKILREIHRGGQGVVYQAVQESTKQKVAIKVMKEGPFAGPGDRARFDREVQVLGQLNHPHIVTIHDTGSAAGHFYFVMDSISGQPLDVYMASGERSIDETLGLFAQICEAVNAAHLKGIIHRDLKPGNIRIDAEGEPYILDFGLAKVATREAGAPVMTITGQFVGSIPWASPEQAEATPGKIDVRTDVYSLGVVLYQMLTGKFPYEVVGNMRDVLDRILTAKPTSPRKVRRQIDDEVETIVLQCLAKERERRYQTAGELARDIRRYQAGQPIGAKGDSAFYVLRKTLRRYKASVAVAAAFVAIVTLATIALSIMYGQKSGLVVELRDERNTARAAEAREREANAELLQRSHRQSMALAGIAYDSGHFAAWTNWLDTCPDGFRGWVWHHLNHTRALSARSYRILGEHEGAVQAVAIDPRAIASYPPGFRPTCYGLLLCLVKVRVALWGPFA